MPTILYAVLSSRLACANCSTASPEWEELQAEITDVRTLLQPLGKCFDCELATEFLTPLCSIPMDACLTEPSLTEHLFHGQWRSQPCKRQSERVDLTASPDFFYISVFALENGEVSRITRTASATHCNAVRPLAIFPRRDYLR